MELSKLIILIYIGISFLALLNVVVTTATIWDAGFGLEYIWLCLLFFFAASRGKRHFAVKGASYADTGYLFKGIRFLVGIICICGVIYTAYYYTGHTPINMISSIRVGESLYSSYQSYFAQNGLGTLALAKVPAVLINCIIEFVVIYSFIYTFTIDKRINRKNLALTIIASIARLYFGFARGANYEMFEIAFLAIYCYWIREGSNRSKRKRIILIIGGVLVCIFFFMTVLGMRVKLNTFVTISSEIYTDEASAFVQLFPVLSKTIAYLGAYFSFGIFFLSYYFSVFLFEDIMNFICGLIPFGYTALGIVLPNNVNTHHLESLCWTPDIMMLIGKFGVLSGPIVYYILGHIYYKFCRIKKEYPKDVYSQMLLFLVVYEMFSLPVGNFVWISSASRITMAGLIFILFIRRYVRLPYEIY